MLGSIPATFLLLSSDQTGELAGIHQHLFSNTINTCKGKLKELKKLCRLTPSSTSDHVLGIQLSL